MGIGFRERVEELIDRSAKLHQLSISCHRKGGGDHLMMKEIESCQGSKIREFIISISIL